LNHTGAVQQITLPATFIDTLRQDERIEGTIALEPYAVRVLRSL